MDAYKTPDSNVNTSYKRPFKPIKAVLLGLSISIILLIIVSVVFAVLFSISVGVDFNEVDAFEKLVTTHTPYLILDLLLSAVLYYFSGIVVGKNTPEKEYKYAIIVSIVTLTFFIIINVISDTGSQMPLWSEILNYLIVPVAILSGARSSTGRTDDSTAMGLKSTA